MYKSTFNSGLVSIIIPTYNRSILLKEAIESCINQTYRPVECIVVDDGSTDNTKEVVEKFIKKRNENFTVKYIYQQNTGSQVARNTGTDAATGEFIQYLDSDDLLYRGKIANQVEYFKDHPGCDAVFGDWELGTMENKKVVIAYKNHNLIEQFLTERCIHTLSILMRSCLVKKVGKWDVDIKRNQEIDFHLRGVLAGGNFEYQPCLTGLWRSHPGERIATGTTFSSTINFYTKWEKILREKNLWDISYSAGIVNNYMWCLGTAPKSSVAETVLLLKEIYRHQPCHPIFQNRKFRVLKVIIGFQNTLFIWVKRFHRNTKEIKT